MERILRITEDGSHTVELGGITYHSIHGAIQESRHVYIEAGLRFAIGADASGRRNIEAGASGGRNSDAGSPGALHVFEMGFGTGLNALLTYQEALRLEMPIYYQTIEQYPLMPLEWEGLNYEEILHNQEKVTTFEYPAPLMGTLHKLHAVAWDTDVQIHPLFTLHKTRGSLEERAPKEGAEILYYDAFAPDDQPELWVGPVFEKLYALLKPGGILVTYCSKGAVRRGLQDSGFSVEKLPGSPGKREMIRARRPI